MPPYDRERAARAIEEFLRAMGHDPSKESDLHETGNLVVDTWIQDILSGENTNVEELIQEGSFSGSNRNDEVVMLRDVEIATMCPHHLMPAMGLAQLAYVPRDRRVGIGTLVRALDALARRLTLQEQIGDQWVDAVMRGLNPQGAACSLRLRHACLCARGRRSEAWVETFHSSGRLASGGNMHGVVEGWMR